jgi:hypothetical protein
VRRIGASSSRARDASTDEAQAATDLRGRANVDHGVGLAIEHHATARAGPLDLQRALVEEAVGIRRGQPFAVAEPLAGLGHIANGKAGGFGDRSEQRAVGTPADRIDADLQTLTCRM